MTYLMSQFCVGKYHRKSKWRKFHFIPFLYVWHSICGGPIGCFHCDSDLSPNFEWLISPATIREASVDQTTAPGQCEDHPHTLHSNPLVQLYKGHIKISQLLKTEGFNRLCCFRINGNVRNSKEKPANEIQLLQSEINGEIKKEVKHDHAYNDKNQLIIHWSHMLC